jgi:hypothetical protein
MALAIVLPTVLVVGLMARRPLPRTSSKTDYAEVQQPIRQSDRLWAKHAIHSVFLRDTSDPTSVQVVLEPLDDISAPDLLVYWSAELSDVNQLPSQAVLLGAFENGQLLHFRKSNPKGFLILYSLAHQSVVDTVSLEGVL